MEYNKNYSQTVQEFVQNLKTKENNFQKELDQMSQFSSNIIILIEDFMDKYQDRCNEDPLLKEMGEEIFLLTEMFDDLQLVNILRNSTDEEIANINLHIIEKVRNHVASIEPMVDKHFHQIPQNQLINIYIEYKLIEINKKYQNICINLRNCDIMSTNNNRR